MKKRIISLILVVVMSVLALASCGYSFAEDDMTQYATFSAEEFLNAIKEFDIKDSDFTEDEETRAKKVLDKLLTTLAGKADTADHKTEGTPGANDIIYYCYYVTAKINEVEYLFMTENMKVEEAKKMDSFQLGLNYYDNDLTEKIVALFNNFTFDKDNTYTQVTDGKVENGSIVYISYERVYDETKDSTVVSVTETASAHRVVLDETNPFHKLLLEKNPTVGTTVSGSIEVKGDDFAENALFESTKGTYSKIKIEWVEKGVELDTVDDTTFDVATNKPTTIYTGSDKNKDLKDVELKYHIYPAYFVETPALTAENIINEVYGESITSDSLATIIFGEDYTKLEDHDEVHELFEKYSFTKDGETLDFEDFVTALDTAITEYNDAKEASDKAKEDLDKAETALTTAKEALEKAQKEQTEKEAAEAAAKDAAEAAPADEDLKKAYEDAKAATAKAKTAVESAQAKVTAAESTLKNEKEDYEGKAPAEGAEKTDFGKLGKTDEALKKRDALVTELFTVLGKSIEGEGEDAAQGAAKIVDGYKQNVTYKTLEDTYNSEIKTKVATFVYDQLKKYVKVTSYPEKAVDDAYDYLIENYENMFYENLTVNGSAVSSSSDSNYKKYNGSFERFLVEYAVPEDLKVKVKNYDEACAAVRKEAERHVSELIVIYIAAQKLDLVLTDDEFEALADEDSNYLYYAESYGENNFRTAYQFNKLLDTLLDPTEEDGKVSYAGKYVTKVTRLTEEEYDAKYPETDSDDTVTE